MMRETRTRREKLSCCSKIVYALPGIPLKALDTFHHSWITIFFVETVKIPPLSFALLHSSERSVAIIAYPFLGLLVDRTRLKERCAGQYCFGRRRIYFYLWAPLFFISLVLIWCVPAIFLRQNSTEQHDTHFNWLPLRSVFKNLTNATMFLETPTTSLQLFSNNSGSLDPPNAPRERGATSPLSESGYIIITLTYLIGEILKALVPVGLPWMALGAEATQDSASRTSLFTMRSVFSMVGHGCGAFVPMLLLWSTGNNRFSAFSTFVIIIGSALVLSFWILSCNTVAAPEKGLQSPTKQQKKCAPLHESRDAASLSQQTRVTFVAGIMHCLSNGPYMRLWYAHAIDSVGTGLAEGMLPFFIQYVLSPQDHGQGSFEFWLCALLLIGYICSACATPVWEWISSEGARTVARQYIVKTGLRKLHTRDWFCLPDEWWGNIDGGEAFRHNAYRLAEYELPSWRSGIDKRFCWLCGWALALPAALLGYSMAAPGNIKAFSFLVAWLGFTVGGTHFLIRPMRADCIDYAQLVNGVRQEASFVMMMEIVPRFLRIPSNAISLAYLWNHGYRPTVSAALQPNRVRDALVLILIVIPMIFSALAFAAAYAYPLTDYLSEQVVTALSELKSRGMAKDPVTGGLVLNVDGCGPRDNDHDSQPMMHDQSSYGHIQLACDSFRLETIVRFLDRVKDQREPRRADHEQTSSSRGLENYLEKRELFSACSWGLIAFSMLIMYSVSIFQHGSKMISIICCLIMSLSVLAMSFHVLRLHPARIVDDLVGQNSIQLNEIVERKCHLAHCALPTSFKSRPVTINETAHGL